MPTDREWEQIREESNWNVNWGLSEKLAVEMLKIASISRDQDAKTEEEKDKPIREYIKRWREWFISEWGGMKVLKVPQKEEITYEKIKPPKEPFDENQAFNEITDEEPTNI